MDTIFITRPANELQTKVKIIGTRIDEMSEGFALWQLHNNDEGFVLYDTGDTLPFRKVLKCNKIE